MATVSRRVKNLAKRVLGERVYGYFKAIALSRAVTWFPNAVRSVPDRLPPRWVAQVEYSCFPRRRSSWGGPFNGQERRKQIFLDVLKSLDVTAIVETGTYRGTTTAFMARSCDGPVFTVEAQARNMHYAKLNLRELRSVQFSLGDSRQFLRDLASDGAVPKERVFFYLDAHWEEDLPLVEEIEIICSHWSEPVIMVDDFEVPGDEGYVFDDYGLGKRLCLSLLDPLFELDLVPFFPAARSDEETGLRRGCVVLAVRGHVADRLASVPSLRRGIQFEQVGLRYDGRAILEDVSLRIPAGKITAIVGASGA